MLIKTLKSIILVFIFISFVPAKHHSIPDVLQPNENYFRKLNSNVQHILKNIFKPLSFCKKFSQMPKIKLFLKMHNDLSDIAENNYKMYMQIRNMSSVDNTINNFRNMVEELVADEITNTLRSEITQVENSVFNDSLGFMDFIDEFIKRIDKINVNDFIKIQDKNLTNLKAWIPSSIEKMDRLKDTRRIFGGKWVKVIKYPFVASVHIVGRFECGASIIAQNLVITAASCLQLVYNRRLYIDKVPLVEVRVGSDYATHGGEVVAAEYVQFHPGYDPRTLHHNIAIIKLRRLIKFSKSKKRVRRIVVDNRQGPLHGIEGVVSLGWGGTDRSNRPGFLPRLNVDALRVYPLDQCKDIYSKHYVTDQHFCAGQGSGACNKDAGGPGVVGGVLTGIISFGPPTCGTKEPTVFTRVGFYIDWIKDIMQRERNIQHRITLRPNFAPLMYAKDEINHHWIQSLPILYPAPRISDSIGNDLFSQILNDVILSKRAIHAVNLNIDRDLQDLFYGDLESDEVFKPTEKQHILQHPLINKSLVFIPEVYGITGTPTHVYTMPLLTTSTPTPEDVPIGVGGPEHSGPMLPTMPPATFAPTYEPSKDILRNLFRDDPSASDTFSDNYE